MFCNYNSQYQKIYLISTVNTFLYTESQSWNLSLHVKVSYKIVKNGVWIRVKILDQKGLTD